MQENIKNTSQAHKGLQKCLRKGPNVLIVQIFVIVIIFKEL